MHSHPPNLLFARPAAVLLHPALPKTGLHELDSGAIRPLDEDETGSIWANTVSTEEYTLDILGEGRSRAEEHELIELTTSVITPIR